MVGDAPGDVRLVHIERRGASDDAGLGRHPVSLEGADDPLGEPLAQLPAELAAQRDTDQEAAELVAGHRPAA